MDAVFRALADPGRRRLLDSLEARNGQSLRELCGELDMSRQAVSKHLAVLEGAELVATAWRGREKLHFLNAAPINAIADRWMTRYDRRRAQVLADLRTALEDDAPMNDFVYVTYIDTTPEKLWQALTEPAFTTRYWGVEFDTDWTVGAPMGWTEKDVRAESGEQKVLVHDPYTTLAYTWHTFTPEWADASGMGREWAEKASGEPRSTVTFTLEPQGSAVKLTVVHGGFPPDSLVRAACSNGWPALLSSLKTLLETGAPLAVG